jgi:SAM-dependent methyltransferase
MNDQTAIQEPLNDEPFVDRIRYDACPLCASSSIRREHVADCSRHPMWKPPLGHQMIWMRCDACGHGFTEGYFTDEALSVVFENTQENQRPGVNVEKNRYVSAAMVDTILPFKDTGRWLDIGFGNGSLLFTAEEYGFEPVGLDMREESVARMRALGFEAHCLDVTKATEIGAFDVISMADVLEHIPFPNEALAAARALLAEDGVLFVSMPNADCFPWRQMTETRTNPYWGELEHYHNFGRARLYQLLQSHGLEPLRYRVSQRYRVGMEVVARKV